MTGRAISAALFAVVSGEVFLLNAAGESPEGARWSLESRDQALTTQAAAPLAEDSSRPHSDEPVSSPRPSDTADESNLTPPAVDPVFPADDDDELEDVETNPLIQPLLRAQQTIVSRQELHRWERHVRGFRREHNFALTSGISRGRWQVKSLGSLDGSYDNSGFYTRFQYSFHLQLHRGFGFLLGSSGGYHYESADRRKPFRPVPSYIFPGVVAGLVLNFNPVLRALITVDSSLERHNGIQERDDSGEFTKVFVTFTAYDLGAAIDIFYDLSWALRLEAHQRHLEYVQPKESATDHPVRANLKKDDQWLGLGLVYHLL